MSSSAEAALSAPIVPTPSSPHGQAHRRDRMRGNSRGRLRRGSRSSTVSLSILVPQDSTQPSSVFNFRQAVRLSLPLTRSQLQSALLCLLDSDQCFAMWTPSPSAYQERVWEPPSNAHPRLVQFSQSTSSEDWQTSKGSGALDFQSLKTPAKLSEREARKAIRELLELQ